MVLLLLSASVIAGYCVAALVTSKHRAAREERWLTEFARISETGDSSASFDEYWRAR